MFPLQNPQPENMLCLYYIDFVCILKITGTTVNMVYLMFGFLLYYPKGCNLRRCMLASVELVSWCLGNLTVLIVYFTDLVGA